MREPDGLGGVPPTLWRMVALARHRLLMLDYDGTLAPFRVQRMEARPSPRTLELLQRVSQSSHTAVAIVSGRPLAEVEALLPGLEVVLVGEHGWEQRRLGGDVIRRSLSHDVVPVLAAAQQAAEDSGFGDLIERKRTAVVLHTRGLSEPIAHDVIGRCERAWSGLARSSAVALDAIQGGLELRARARNKGTVVLSLLSQAPAGTLGVFVGDDVTDEDAFEAIQDQGFGVRVGADDAPTVAQGRLDSCDSMPDFLEEWLRVCAPRASDA